MDLHYSQTNQTKYTKFVSFTTLWIYTILKRIRAYCRMLFVSLPYGFTLFSNKTAQKVCRGKFHYLMDLHYSQTYAFIDRVEYMFHYLMDLHYSQTKSVIVKSCNGFTTLWIYTILKPVYNQFGSCCRFTTLWIYTILKQQHKHGTLK